MYFRAYPQNGTLYNDFHWNHFLDEWYVDFIWGFSSSIMGILAIMYVIYANFDTIGEGIDAVGNSILGVQIHEETEFRTKTLDSLKDYELVHVPCAV